MYFGNAFNNYSKALVRLVYPPFCFACENILKWHEEKICSSCAASLRPPRDPLCPRCARELGPFSRQKICFECVRDSNGLEQTWAVYFYNAPMRRLLHQVKFQGFPSLLAVFQSTIKEFLISHPLPRDIDCVVPVPMDSWRKWRRGFNQADLLAKTLSECAGLPAMDILKKVRLTAPQSQLKSAARAVNLRDCLAVRKNFGLSGKTILLVDDIYTTGNTLKTCGKFLKEQGARKVYAFILARAGKEWD